ncbi:MAG: hypothetical protein Pg6A_07870 [Termitinemataceae bacterium]|nr:MAG: hypothetical protein Pg6A_07870 [Termitinemataceae bacterium]
MVKKVVLTAVLALSVSSGVFADDWTGRLFNIKSGPTTQNGVLFVDLGYIFQYLAMEGFGLGAGWEQKVNKNWTWLINGSFGLYSHDYYLAKYDAFEVGGEVNGRYYFFGSAVDKLFFNFGLGFTYASWTWKYDIDGLDDETIGWGALTIPLYVGWKFIIGPGFVAELDLGYRVGVGLFKPSSIYGDYKPSFGGLLYGLRLGWAF